MRIAGVGGKRRGTGKGWTGTGSVWQRYCAGMGASRVGVKGVKGAIAQGVHTLTLTPTLTPTLALTLNLNL